MPAAPDGGLSRDRTNTRGGGPHGRHKETAIPGEPAAFPVAPVSDLSANSMFLLGKPISMSWATAGAAGAAGGLRLFALTARMCRTGVGIAASLALQSSQPGLGGYVASTARHWHTANAAAWANERGAGRPLHVRWPTR